MNDPTSISLLFSPKSGLQNYIVFYDSQRYFDVFFKNIFFTLIIK
jgi:hypothetical protein